MTSVVKALIKNKNNLINNLSYCNILKIAKENKRKYNVIEYSL